MTPVRTRKSNPKEREGDRRPIRFNGEISIGTIISLGAMIMSLYGFYNSANQKVAEESHKVTEGMTKVDTRLAVVETKVDAMWKSFRVITGQGN